MGRQSTDLEIKQKLKLWRLSIPPPSGYSQGARVIRAHRSRLAGWLAAARIRPPSRTTQSMEIPPEAGVCTRVTSASRLPLYPHFDAFFRVSRRCGRRNHVE
eukprot:4384245-Amphidinium_carterae.1